MALCENCTLWEWHVIRMARYQNGTLSEWHIREWHSIRWMSLHTKVYSVLQWHRQGIGGEVATCVNVIAHTFLSEHQHVLTFVGQGRHDKCNIYRRHAVYRPPFADSTYFANLVDYTFYERLAHCVEHLSSNILEEVYPEALLQGSHSGMCFLPKFPSAIRHLLLFLVSLVIII